MSKAKQLPNSAERKTKKWRRKIMKYQTDPMPQAHRSLQSQGRHSSRTNRNSDRTIRTTESSRWTGRHGHIAQEIQHGSEVVHSSPTSVDKIKDLTVPIRKVSHSSPITAESNGDFTVPVRKIPPGRQSNGLGITTHPTVDDNRPYTHVGLGTDVLTVHQSPA